MYAAVVEEFGAHHVLDLGCGTGTFAILLTDRGVDVVGVDPAAGSLDVARAKPSAGRVRWVHGDASTLPALEVDLATMTGNVAQAVVDPQDWDRTLRGLHRALRPGGGLVSKTRVPTRRAWQQWQRAATECTTDVPGVGAVTKWVDVTKVDGSLVSFRGTWVFASNGATLTSDSTLRFRERDEVEADLVAHGYLVDEVRDASDRPGQEFVSLARRPA